MAMGGGPARALRSPSWRRRTWSWLVAWGTVLASRARFASAVSVHGGDVSGARRGSAVRWPLYQVEPCFIFYQVGPCFIFDRAMLIGRTLGTWGWTVNEIPSTPDHEFTTSSGHVHRPGSSESEGATDGRKSSASLDGESAFLLLRSWH